MRAHKSQGLTSDERFWMKVEKTDTCWNWTASKREGYGLFREQADRPMVSAHRRSYESANGPIPDGMIIDHICHNPSCVRPSHLREATRKQNGEHRAGPNTGTASGILGVRQKESGRWIARVTHDGKAYSAGTFASKAEAEEAAVSLRLELFTHNEHDKRRDAA